MWFELFCGVKFYRSWAEIFGFKQVEHFIADS